MGKLSTTALHTSQRMVQRGAQPRLVGEIERQFREILRTAHLLVTMVLVHMQIRDLIHLSVTPSNMKIASSPSSGMEGPSTTVRPTSLRMAQPGVQLKSGGEIESWLVTVLGTVLLPVPLVPIHMRTKGKVIDTKLS